VARPAAGLHADDHRLLADIEVAEPADEAHAVHLPGLLLEAADEQHVAVELQELGGADLRLLHLGLLGLAFGDGHGLSLGDNGISRRNGAPVGCAVTWSRRTRKATPNCVKNLSSRPCFA